MTHCLIVSYVNIVVRLYTRDVKSLILTQVSFFNFQTGNSEINNLNMDECKNAVYTSN